MKKFPWDCEDCPLLCTYDLSVDDLTHVCLWSKNQIDDCDRYKYAECPLEKHDKEIQAAERQKVLEEVTDVIKKKIGYSWITTSDILENVEYMKGEQNE